LEIIVVDDDSTDQTVNLISQFGSDRLRLIRHPQNRGAAAARNTGITAAQGRWIAFLDADDAWKPDKLALQVAAIKRVGPSAAACSTGYDLHKDGRELTINLNLSPKQFRRDILFGCTISPGTTLLVERRVFDEIGMFDESFRRLEDWDWLLRFAKRHDMVFVATSLADVYLMNGRSRQIKKEFDPVIDALSRIRQKHLPHLDAVERLQLRSSLLVERAAMHYRRGRPVRASMYVLVACFIYPHRNLAFFHTLRRAVSELLRPRGR